MLEVGLSYEIALQVQITNFRNRLYRPTRIGEFFYFNNIISLIAHTSHDTTVSVYHSVINLVNSITVSFRLNSEMFKHTLFHSISIFNWQFPRQKYIFHGYIPQLYGRQSVPFMLREKIYPP